MIRLIKIFFVFILIIPSLSKAQEEEKNCIYCLKYEKMMDWPIENRPAIFIYQEEINYPQGMFGEENKMAAAGTKVGYRFVKKKKSLGKHPGPMIMDMAYFEVLFNEMLNQPSTKVEKLEKLLNVRSAFRQTLNIGSTASAEEAILKFYSIGKMMRSAKKKKLDSKKQSLI